MDVYITAPISNNNNLGIVYDIFNGGTWVVQTFVLVYPNGGDGFDEILTAINAGVAAYATANSLTLTNYSYWFNKQATATNDGLMSAADKTKLNGLSAPLSRSFNNAPGRSIVSGTGATGFQVSASRDAQVSYSPTLQTTATIAGNVSDVVVLEIASTNSATPADWIEISRVTNIQALSLALTLQSVQGMAGSLHGIIPAGWYAKIRAITSGTITNSVSSGQEVLL